MNAAQEMKRWACHKVVHAEKISKIIRDGEGENRESDGSAKLFFDGQENIEGFGGNVHVEHDFMNKHKPEVGGYYVVYADGYKSFSPAKAFEDGYTRVS